MMARLALSLANSWRPENRWRRIVVPLSAVVASLALLFATGLWNALDAQDRRIVQRQGVAASTPADSDLLIIMRDDYWNGVQFATILMEPAGAGETVLPPGMNHMLQPGESFVSPALMALIESEPEMAARYPNATLLASESVADDEELWAWVRPVSSSGFSEYPVTIRIARFGPDGTEHGIEFGMFPRMQQIMVIVSLLLLLGLPGLLTLVIGASSISALKERRVETLEALGAARWWIARLVATETAILMVPPIVLVAIAWYLLAPKIDYLPVMNKDVLHGSLAVSLQQTVIVALLLLSAGLSAGLMSCGYRWFRADLRKSRSVRERRVGDVVRFVPFAASAVFFVYIGFIASTASAELTIVAFMSLVITTPFVAPLLARPIGGWIARFDAVPATLAGRRLEHDPKGTIRPFVALGVIVMAGAIVIGFLAWVGQREPSARVPPASDTSAAQVHWGRSLTANNPLLTRESEKSDWLVTPYVVEQGVVRIAADCAEVAQFLGITPGNCAVTMPGAAESRVGRSVRDLLYDRYLAVEFTPGRPAQSEEGSGFLVLAHEPVSALVTEIRTLFPRNEYLGFSVDSFDYANYVEPEFAGWLERGVLIAFIIAGFACVVSLIDRLLVGRTNRRLLISLGLTNARIAWTEALAFLIPFTLITGVCFAIGVANIQMFRGIKASPMPWTDLTTLAGLLLAAGIVSALAIALLGASDAEQEHTVMSHR